jgi:NADH:ubiquinone oxidoreductase subunit 3 (subunit A)
MDGEVATFYPILVYAGVIVLLIIGMVGASHFLGPHRHTPVKDMPYESGMDPIGDARQHFDVKYYLVAILFLVFDVELLFLYPWAVSAYMPVVGVDPLLRGAVFGIMLSFLMTLVIAYIYAWRKGVFKWR